MVVYCRYVLLPGTICISVSRSLGGPHRHGDRDRYGGQEGRFDPFGLWDPGAAGGRSPRVKIYQIAYRLKGRITVSDIVVEAEKLIQSMVVNQRVRMRVRDDGLIFYEFPEIISRYSEGSREAR